MKINTSGLGLIILTLAGCNVTDPPDSTGGTNFDAVGGSSAAQNSRTGGSGGSAGSTLCPKGLVVVMTDHKSTNVALTRLDGSPLTESFVSSGAAKPGLALALSGDVEVPQIAPVSGRVVLIDRFGSNVITWLDPKTGNVLSQLPVGTGFESNPQDYLEFGADRALVSRFETNAAPGKTALDAGGDLLIIDTKTPALLDRIPMPEENPALLPRPGRMTRLRDQVVVSLGRLSSDYQSIGDGRFVGVSPEEKKIAWTVDIPGLVNCGGFSLSPSGKQGAIACTSQYNSTTQAYDPAKSDVVVYDTTVTPPLEVRRLGLGVKVSAGIQSTLTFASENQLLALTYGGNKTVGDTAIAVNATTGEVLDLGATSKPYNLGGIFCSPGCGDLCLVSDAERGKLRRWQVAADGTFTAIDDQVVDQLIGLPPRSISAL